MILCPCPVIHIPAQHQPVGIGRKFTLRRFQKRAQPLFWRQIQKRPAAGDRRRRRYCGSRCGDAAVRRRCPGTAQKVICHQAEEGRAGFGPAPQRAGALAGSLSTDEQIPSHKRRKSCKNCQEMTGEIGFHCRFIDFCGKDDRICSG